MFLWCRQIYFLVFTSSCVCPVYHTWTQVNGSVRGAACMQELFTVCDGAAELQQAAEGERGHVSFAPAARLLLYILLKLDPARSLLPTHFMVLHDQLVQLHKQLRRERSRGRVWASKYKTHGSTAVSCLDPAKSGQRLQTTGNVVILLKWLWRNVLMLTGALVDLYFSLRMHCLT